MALRLANSGREPLGQFDCVDSELASFKGGEVCSFAYVTTEGQPGVSQTGLDEAAYDVFDGYVNHSGTLTRPAVSKAWTTTVATSVRPLFLSDDGVVGYGTLLGVVVGGTVGQTSYGPASSIPSSAVIGPSTALGSGKMTLWDKPGLYQVTLDAVDTAAVGGLSPLNTAITGGQALYFTNGGNLTTITNTAVGAPVVGHFVEFNTNGSLVTTPNYLVAALNSPSGIVSSLQARSFTVATIYFAPPST
jgi:hypothetical protein